MTTFFKVGNFIQPLWQSVQNSDAHDKNEVWNGAVEATSTFAGGLMRVHPQNFQSDYLHSFTSWSVKFMEIVC